MGGYYLALCLHLLGAAVWAGGHLVLALSVLPAALRERRAAPVEEFERRFERVGLPALGIQVLSGLWLAHHLLGAPGQWFGSSPVAHVVQVKLGLLAVTVIVAIHARVRVVPRLSDESLPRLAVHIRVVTALAVVFVLAGASIRVGGYPVFDR